MDSTAAAMADLEISLESASSAYRKFAQREDVGPGREILSELGAERREDANRLRAAAEQADLEKAEPTLDEQQAFQLLGLGKSEPTGLGAIAARVRRAEGRLSQLIAQLATVTSHDIVRGALTAVRHSVERRSAEVRDLRRLARVLVVRQLPHTDGFDVMHHLALADGLDRAAAVALPNVEGEELDVWFGTNRARRANGAFTGARGHKTVFGHCRVFVPIHRRLGSLGSGWLGRLLRGDDRVKLLNETQMLEPDFWSALSTAQATLKDSEREALVFLHGYRTTFKDAARRTAQLKADLEHQGPAVFFSWPSLGPNALYTGDEAAIEGSEVAIRAFLLDLVEKSGVRAVHVIAHSMGNRALLRALDAIARDESWRERARFGQIILAAPDVDVDAFTDLAAAYTRLVERSTLYVAENDLAIGVSNLIHGYPRVGRAPPIVVVPEVDTVNASQVNLGLIGHGYAAEIRPVLTDIFELVRRGTPPEQRFGLRRVASPGAGHWVFRA